MSTKVESRGLQLGFNAAHHDVMYASEGRQQKGRKTLTILRDHLGAALGTCRVADIGCSAGLITEVIAPNVGEIVGIDIDADAVEEARQRCREPNARFEVYDGGRLPLPDESIDLVLFTHVYEHTADAQAAMDEIYRILRPGGCCYFAAGNRFIFIEQHYRLPLLSVIPTKWADWYLRILGRGDSYYERHLTYWQLKKLVRRFERIDYTQRVIDDPAGFHATDMLRPGSLKHLGAMAVARYAMWLCPGYLWILHKKQSDCQS